MKRVLPTLEPIRADRRAYVAINLAYYGVILVTMLLTIANRAWQERFLGAVQESLTTGSLSPAADIYESGLVPLAIGVTFVVNLFVGSLATITLPSLIVPFSGLALGVVRALAWGVLFSPELAGLTPGRIVAGAFVAGLLFLEGQGYVLAMFAAWRQSLGLVRPSSLGTASRLEALGKGLGLTLRAYVWVAAVLLVAAVYEAVGAILLMPRLV